MKKLLLLSTLLISFSQVAVAQDYDYNKKWGLGGSFGFNFPIFGNSFNDEADSGESWGLHGRYHMTSADFLELGFTKHEFQDTTQALNVYDLMYGRRFIPMGRFTPIAGIGAGVVDVNNYDPGSLKLGLKLRGGVEYALSQNINLGFNVDYQQVNKMLFAANLPGGNIHTLAARVGMTWYFGGTTAAVASTAAGAGAAGAAVASDDFASEKLSVNYATGDSQVNEAYESDIEELAQYMEENPEAKVELQGYTDNVGSTELNQELSQQRAEEVKSHLTNEGIDASRIDAVGYGEERPIADNATPEGRVQNRRVIGIIIR